MAKSNSKVRLHYLDIREFFNLNIIVSKIQPDVNKILLNFKTNYDNNLLKNLLRNLEKSTRYLDSYIKTVENNINEIIINKNISDKNNKINYYLNKIINIYENKDLQKKLNNYLISAKNNYIKILTNLIDNIYNKINDLKSNKYSDLDKNILEIQDLFNKLFAFIVILNSKITDVYLLRRVLDKDYVTKGIIYSGLAHSVNYIEFLIKNYDFKITYVYYLNDNRQNPESITNLIKKYSNGEIMKLFSKEQQCVDIDDKDD